MSDIGPDQIPVPGGGTGVNQPEKPYGQVADLNKLRQSFPQGAQGAGPLPPAPGGPLGPPGAPPPGGGGSGQPFKPGGGGGGPLPGLPAGIMDPTSEPGVPVDTPLSPPPGGPMGAPGGAVVTPSQNRLRIIEALRQSDDPETKEWAEMMIRLLTQA